MPSIPPIADERKLSFPQYAKKLKQLLGHDLSLVELQRAKNWYSYDRSPRLLFEAMKNGLRR